MEVFALHARLGYRPKQLSRILEGKCLVKQTVLAVLIMGMSILAASAAAQDEKNELTGMLGRIFISDQGIQGPNTPTVNPFVRSGKGLTFET